MFFLHARLPLRLDCESWEGTPSLDLAGFGATRDVIELISAHCRGPQRQHVACLA
jgi:hypothetical protein